MASHFSSLGFAVAAEGDLFALAQRLGPDAEPTDTPAGSYFRWADPSGAEVWLQTSADGEQFFGAVPHLGGDATVTVTVEYRVPPAGEASPLDGAVRGVAGGTPVMFDVPDFRRLDGVGLPAAVAVQLCGFAHEAEGFASEAAFRAAADGKLEPATRSMIAVGLLDDGPPRPLAFVTGVVTASGWRTNRLTQQRFGVVSLDTPVGGIVVAVDPVVLAELPPAGGVLSGTLWLSGVIVGLGERPV